MIQLSTTTTPHVLFLAAIGVLLVLAIGATALYRLLSINPIDLETQPKGHKGYDRANRECESLQLQLDVFEDLEGDPASLNQLADRLAVAKMTRDAEEVNMEHQRKLVQLPAPSPETDRVGEQVGEAGELLFRPGIGIVQSRSCSQKTSR